MRSETRQLHLMGTVITLKVQAIQPAPILDEAAARLRDYQNRFSANDQASELMQINHHAGEQAVVVDDELYELIKIGKTHSIAPDSLLNIAIGPLIQTWRIGFSDANYPGDEQIKQLLPLIQPQQIVLNDETHAVFLAKKKMAIDLGSLAKGYFADKIIGFFKEASAANGLIDLGGNVLTFGTAPTQPDGLWRIGIQNPFLPRGNYALVLKTKDKSVVTSGIYERKFLWQGKEYHHIFDSQTGYPLQSDVASITIVSDQSLDGEIWTTRLFGKSPEECIQTINQLPMIEGIVITKAGEYAVSSGMTPYLA